MILIGFVLVLEGFSLVLKDVKQMLKGVPLSFNVFVSVSKILGGFCMIKEMMRLLMFEFV